jgi:hypothetical protein
MAQIVRVLAEESASEITSKLDLADATWAIEHPCVRQMTGVLLKLVPPGLLPGQ